MIESVMKKAVNAFKNICPDWCELKPSSKQLYTLIKISEWPVNFLKLHYEFRLNNNDNTLFVECHIEDKEFQWLGETFNRIANDLKNIQEYKLSYYFTDSPKKKWPFLRIEYGFSLSESDKAAQVMLELINKTKDTITNALNSSGIKLKSKVKPPHQPIYEEFLPDWLYVKTIIDGMEDEAPTYEAILDHVEKRARTEGKLLKKNWREITRRNIPLWLAAYHE